MVGKRTPGPYQHDGRFVFKLIDNPDPKRGRPKQVNLWMASVQPCGISVETAELEAVATLFAAAPDLLAALEAVEWIPVDTKGIVKVCPRCGNVEQMGHSSNCIIGNALKKSRGWE